MTNFFKKKSLQISINCDIEKWNFVIIFFKNGMDFVQLPISFLDSDTDVNFSKSAQWVPAPPCLFEGGYYPIFYPIGTGMVGKKKIRTQIWYGNDYVIPAPEYPYPPQTWTRGCCQPACQASPCKAVRAVDKEMSYNWKEKFIGDRAEREGLGSGFGKQKRTKTEVIFNAQKLIWDVQKLILKHELSKK